MDALTPLGRFPASLRLRKRPEFLCVQRRGRRVTTRHFVLALWQRDLTPGAETRLGITTSRHVGCAVVRSRLRRLVREAFRATRPLWPAGLDVVVIVREAEPGLSRDGVVQEWLAAGSALARRAAEVRRAAESAEARR